MLATDGSPHHGPAVSCNHIIAVFSGEAEGTPLLGVTIADDGGHVYRGLADRVEPRAQLVQRRRVRQAELLSQQGRGVLHVDNLICHPANGIVKSVFSSGGEINIFRAEII